LAEVTKSTRGHKNLLNTALSNHSMAASHTIILAKSFFRVLKKA
jgi:hypothetical protein